VTITLKDLDIGAALDRAGLIVRGPVLDGLNVVLAPSPVEAASDKGAKPADEKSATLAGEGKAAPGDKTQAASKPEPMVLPAVRLPFPIQLEGMQVTAFRYQQGELVEGLDNLLLSATAEEERIDIRELSLRHAMADLALKWSGAPARGLPLALTLDAKARQGLLDGELQGEQVNLVLDGSVGKLGLALRPRGRWAPISKDPLRPSTPICPSIWRWTGRASWPLHKPAKDEPSYRLDKGSLSAKGKLSGYQFALNTAGKGTDVPPSRWRSRAGGSQPAEPYRAAAGGPQGELKLDGKLAWSKGSSGRGRPNSRGSTRRSWCPRSRALAGKITSRFDLDEAGHWQLALPELKVDGKLNQYPLALQGRLSGNDKMEWTIPALALQSGPNRLQAKGSLTTQAWKLDADLDAPKLGGIYPGLGGDIKGQVRVTGNQQAPRVNADLVSGRLAYAGTVLKETVIKANALVGEKPAGEVAVTVASLAQGETKLSQIALNLSGDLERHGLTLTMKGIRWRQTSA
jgi:translocation and assembly module TamB